jgi:hypothetical protein
LFRHSPQEIVLNKIKTLENQIQTIQNQVKSRIDVRIDYSFDLLARKYI